MPITPTDANVGFWIKAPVGLFDNPDLAGPYDRRSAFLWLVANASRAERRVATARGGTHTLRRGEVLAGAEHLAMAWGWTRKRVRSFLVRLVAAHMIARGPARGQYADTYFIIAFDSYQGVGAAEAIERANEGPTTGQRGARLRDGRDGREGESPPIAPRRTTAVDLSREASPGPTNSDCLAAFEAWNALALRCGLPQAAKLTPDRQRKCAARLRDYGLDGWERALTNIERSAFLTGSNDRGWRATLDWLLSPAAFGKTYDGGYTNGRHAVPSKADERKAHCAKLLEGIKARAASEAGR